jgi:hypothetical protein
VATLRDGHERHFNIAAKIKAILGGEFRHDDQAGHVAAVRGCL